MKQLGNTFGILALIFGIIGIFLNMVIIIPVLAIIFGIIGISRDDSRGKSTAGLILGIIGLILGILFWLWIISIMQ